MKQYRVDIKWQHRKWGPQTWAGKINASNIRLAAGRAIGVFRDQLKDAKERRDADKTLEMKLNYLGKAEDNLNPSE